MTVEQVLELTGVVASTADVLQAQAIIEAVSGRTADAVLLAAVDTVGLADAAWFSYAVAWQVAYMQADGTSVFEQANVQAVAQDDYSVTFGDRTFAIAPLAHTAVQRLSWRGSRSVATGPVGRYAVVLPWEFD